MVQNVQYLCGLPSHMTLPFEFQTPVLSRIQVFVIQIVTVMLFVICTSKIHDFDCPVLDPPINCVPD